jgi:hypothetical protein
LPDEFVPEVVLVAFLKSMSFLEPLSKACVRALLKHPEKGGKCLQKDELQHSLKSKEHLQIDKI